MSRQSDISFPDPEDTPTISYYIENITIEVNSTDELLSLTVSAENGTKGTILVIRIGEGVLSDLDNLIVTYDGYLIDEFLDVEEFFNLKGNTTPGRLRFLTKTGLYLFVRVPHFSEHTITIGSIPLEEIMRYTGFVIIAGIIVIAIASLVMFRQGKEE